MAGDWVRVRVSLLTAPKVLRIVEELHDDPVFLDWWVVDLSAPRTEVEAERVLRASRYALRYVTVTALVQVWGAAREHSKGGILRSATIADIDALAGIPRFGRAMEAVGWAQETDDGDVMLPEFDRYNKALDRTSAQRMREYRRRKRGENPRNATRNVTSPLPVTLRHRDAPDDDDDEMNPPLPPQGGAGGGGSLSEGPEAGKPEAGKPEGEPGARDRAWARFVEELRASGRADQPEAYAHVIRTRQRREGKPDWPPKIDTTRDPDVEELEETRRESKARRRKDAEARRRAADPERAAEALARFKRGRDEGAQG